MYCKKIRVIVIGAWHCPVSVMQVNRRTEKWNVE
jgi:hypothetical protein